MSLTMNLENYQLSNYAQNNPDVRVIFYPITSWVAERIKNKNKDVSFLDEFQDLIEKHYHDDRFRAKQCARMMKMSETQLFKRLKSLTNQGFASYLRIYRLRKAKDLIEYNQELTISEIAYDVGFTDPNYFSRAFSQIFGQSPSSYRRTSYS